MRNIVVRLTKTWILMGVIIVGALGANYQSVDAVTDAVSEGKDFATLVLRDPWDMSEDTDISQYINSDGQYNQLQNIQVTNGIFSSKSTTDRFNAKFYLLFPGYLDTLSAGKVGDRYPIPSNQYKCLYIAMKVDSEPGSSQFGPDAFEVYWFADKRNEGGTFGSIATTIYPSSPINHFWNLFKVDLTRTPSQGVPWTSQNWRGLRIDPTNQPNIPFQVDWARLTSCTSTNYTVSWSGASSNVAIWARPEGTSRNIRIAAGLSGSSANLDLQGLQPGNYELFMSTSSDTCCGSSLGNLRIEPAPIVQFSSPSFTSGFSYGDFIGNDWDMSAMNDLQDTDCMNISLGQGKLLMDTASVEQQSGGCNGGGVADPKIWLTSPQTINTNDYRYLTFRIYTQGPWQTFGKGMLVRWIWGSKGCYLVTRDIPLDVGWQTYSIDLKDAYAGQAQQWIGSCSGTTWQNTNPAGEFRLDPNENISGGTFHQELDWVELTKMSEVKQGALFPIGISLNKPQSSVQIKFFYSRDRVQLTPAVIKTPSSGTPPGNVGNIRVYLPLIRNGPPQAAGDYLWDTQGVATGEYYICAEAKDGYNTMVYCSEAPVIVIP